MNGCPSQLNNFLLLLKFEGTFTTQWWVGVIVFPACQQREENTEIQEIKSDAYYN